MRLDFTPFPTLTTPRLVLRALAPSDLPRMFLFRCDAAVAQSNGTFVDETLAQSQAYIERMSRETTPQQWLYWVIADANDELIGSVCIWNFCAKENSGELGYAMMSQHQNKGYMTEALAVVERFAFSQMELSCLNAYTEKGNESSVRLLEKLNYARVDEIFEPNGRGEQVSMVIYKKTDPQDGGISCATK